MTDDQKVALFSVLALVVVAAASAPLLVGLIDFSQSRGEVAAAVAARTPAAPPVLGHADFLASRPEDAPPDLREAAMLGYRIFTATPTFARSAAANGMSCATCHFEGGRTEGGRNGGISLVGAAGRYPAYAASSGRVWDLAARVNDCVQANLLGAPLPVDGAEMVSLLTYLHWIGRGVPAYAQARWLGLRTLAPTRAADANAGRQVYADVCAKCHGPSGDGTLIAPAVWGPRSFSRASRLADAAAQAAFEHDNMPRGTPTLSPDQAADVASFVTSQPRPDGAAR